MRCYTQRRDARNGQRHTLAEDIRMAALEALLPEELERPEVERRSCSLRRSKRYVAPKPGQVTKVREDGDDPIDVGGFGQRKGRSFSKGNESHWHWQRKREQEKMEKMVRNHQDERTHRKLKVNVGIVGKQVIN